VSGECYSRVGVWAVLLGVIVLGATGVCACTATDSAVPLPICEAAVADQGSCSGLVVRAVPGNECPGMPCDDMPAYALCVNGSFSGFTCGIPPGYHVEGSEGGTSDGG